MARPPSLPGRVYRALAFGWLATKAAVLLVNAVAFPRLRPVPKPAPRPRVSLLVPARNEAHVLPHTLPGLLAQGADEVLVLDDRSEDATAQVAAAVGARVIPGALRPDGWYGKPWACQQLLHAAPGDVLVFVDADVTWEPGALDAVLHELERTAADLLSVQPRQRPLTPGERVLTPLVDSAVLSYFPYPLIRLPQPAAGMANGQVMALRRAPLEAVGGFHAVRREVLDDTAFARHVKARGGRLAVALGGGLISVRMYRSYPQSVLGFAKNALPLHVGSRPLLVLSALAHLAVYTLPWLCRVPGWRVLRVVGVLERVAVNVISGRSRPADLLEGVLGPLTPLAALPVYALALRRTVTWKGRRYRQA